jgi:hypothetical protein
VSEYTVRNPKEVNMAVDSASLDLLVGEYEVLIEEARFLDAGSDGDWSTLEALLIRDAGWSHRGASEIVRLIRGYGSFFLRNAAALAVALGIEDGQKGL